MADHGGLVGDDSSHMTHDWDHRVGLLNMNRGWD